LDQNSIPYEVANRRLQLKRINPNHVSDHQRHSGDAMYLMQRNILAPKNANIDEVNNVILELLFEELHTYLSANSLTST